MPTELCACPITKGLPPTLLKWHAYRTPPMHGVWEPLRAWFASEGLHIFDPQKNSTLMTVTPQINEIRAHDGTYSTPYGPPRIAHEHRRAVHCIARTTDGRDVLIRLITRAGQGHEELRVLQHIAIGHRAFLGDNHCLPMLRTLVLEDMTFGVFPFMYAAFTSPWYHHVGEVFDAVLQVLQGFEFLHRHLIAHRDVGADNILINVTEGQMAPMGESGEQPFPFRGLFPVRYYIIDFELSTRFPEDSTPDRRVVTGLPLLRHGYDHPDDYGRDIAPEMLLDAPYCPFKSDIFQLGKVFLSHFRLLETEFPVLVQTFQSMTELNPSRRPTAAEALESIREYHEGFTRAQLRGRVPKPVIDTLTLEERMQRAREANARQEAREKESLKAELHQPLPAIL